MKRITDFIVEKRKIILFLFIILTFISMFLSRKVNINYDMTNYLPDSSETKTGINIMNKEFSKEASSSFNIMFKNLSDKEKDDIYNYLKNNKNIATVDYKKDSEDYNKDDYTLYTVNVDAKDDSPKAKQVYEEVTNKYEDYEFSTSGSIASKNGDVLPLWIIVVAVSICLVILIFMCESYIEPFLFLFTIGIAVILNAGSNIIFSSVSNVTNSISAILQMALSMDYSIMLMNRYRQEKEKYPDKIAAMKQALYQSLKAISSSSLTTIVGLLALIFMSFTIGKDLGFVLAKGVLLSLISIFFCLPALILTFDNLITKTKKNVLNLHMTKIGKFSYKIRYISIPILVLCFGISFVLKGGLKTLYTTSEKDEIKKVFKENNQMVVVYKNQDEKTIADKCHTLENLKDADSVLCYGNTINEPIKYQDLNKKLNDFDMDIDVEDYLLKILYYNYYNQKENKISMENLVDFLKNEANKEGKISDELDSQSLNKLSNFTTIEGITKPRNIKDISNLLNIDVDSVKSLLVLYNSKNVNQKITIPDFTNFIKNKVLTNKTYSNQIPKSALNSINTLEKYTNKKTITKAVNYKEIAKLFNMDANLTKQLYLYYFSINGVDTKLTINQLSKFIIENKTINTTYNNLISKDEKEKIKLIYNLSDKNTINKSLNSEALSNMFNIDKSLTDKVLLSYYSTQESDTKMTLSNFINSVIYLKNNTEYLDQVNIDNLIALQNDPKVVNNPTLYKASELSSVVGIDKELLYKIYALIDYSNNNTDNWVMTPYQFVNLVLESVNTNSNLVDEKTIEQLKLLKEIMDSSLKNQTYTYKNLSQILNIDESKLKSIYSLYTLENKNLKMTPKQFVDFILKNKQSDVLKGKLDSKTLKSLVTLQNVMNGVISNKKYSVNQISSIFNIDKAKIKLLYSLYQLEKNNYSLNISLQKLVNFILDDVVTKKEYSNLFSDSSLEKLTTLRKIMIDLDNNKKYTSQEFYQTVKKLDDGLNQDMIELLYIYYGSVYNYQNKYTLTLEQLVDYLNEDILKDAKYDKFIDNSFKEKVVDAKDTIKKAKDNLVGNNYSRIVINTELPAESKETFNFIKNAKEIFKNDKVYFAGDSLMAYEMNDTFDGELNSITILTMISIFIVVALTFKSLSIPCILVLIIQTAVYVTMGVLSLLGGSVYFISILIVQSILLGATIDYAILYTSYYEEIREKYDKKEAVTLAYDKSINTILTSSSILIIVTFVVGIFAEDIASKICITLCQGTICSVILILLLLPAILVFLDKFIIKKKNKN